MSIQESIFSDKRDRTLTENTGLSVVRSRKQLNAQRSLRVMLNLRSSRTKMFLIPGSPLGYGRSLSWAGRTRYSPATIHAHHPINPSCNRHLTSRSATPHLSWKPVGTLSSSGWRVWSCLVSTSQAKCLSRRFTVML